MCKTQKRKWGTDRRVQNNNAENVMKEHNQAALSLALSLPDDWAMLVSTKTSKCRTIVVHPGHIGHGPGRGTTKRRERASLIDGVLGPWAWLPDYRQNCKERVPQKQTIGVYCLLCLFVCIVTKIIWSNSCTTSEKRYFSAKIIISLVQFQVWVYRTYTDQKHLLSHTIITTHNFSHQ